MTTQENIPPSFEEPIFKCEFKNKVHLKDVLDNRRRTLFKSLSRLYQIVHKGESAPVLDVVAKREKGFVRVFACIARVLIVRFPRASRS